ncbi:uncharacterized protein LOC134278108, partial [Saccostrea cucullata]|uniref:uncharacterized protein LOC134278108 n=1 Tax=Saccostrea cuccullata TaxID=36930 RepID=UPI002ED321C8
MQSDAFLSQKESKAIDVPGTEIMPPVRTKTTQRASRKRREAMGTPSRGRGQRCRQSTRPNHSPPRRAPVEPTDADGIPSEAPPTPSVIIEPTLSLPTDKSTPGTSSGGGASTDMHAVSAELPTQVSGVQSNGLIYSLGTTPMKLTNLCKHLVGYSDCDFIFQGFKYGFNLQYLGPRSPRESSNFPSLKANTVMAEIKIQKEVVLKRVAGPFLHPPIPNLQVSPLDLVPKKDGDMRLIHHLSYPENKSINDFIDPEACTLHYSNIDQAAEMIAK